MTGEKTVHLIVQGKGGVGKSLVASLLCQYLQGKKQPAAGQGEANKGQRKEAAPCLLAMDTDPVNHTLAGYKALPVEELEIRDGQSISQRKFDALMERVLEAEVEDVVIDNGASTFLPLLSWMVENRIVELWEESGLRVLFHTVITGGQALMDTMEGLATLIEYFQAPVVVWLNPYFGEIRTQDSPDFTEFRLYKQHAARIPALISLPLKNAATFGEDLAELFARHQTFAEAGVDQSLGILPRQRLKIWWAELVAAMDQAFAEAGLLGEGPAEEPGDE